MIVFAGNKFPIENRLCKSWEYKNVQRTGFKIRLKNFTVLYNPRKVEATRLGLIVSRKVGNAVHRNKVKRLVREFFRKNHKFLPEKRDFVVIARRGAVNLDYFLVENELKTLFRDDLKKPVKKIC